MLIFENIVITLLVVYFFVFFRASAPPTPPSFAAMRNHTSITQGMGEDFLILMKNRNFVLTLVAYTLIFCIYTGIGAILPFLWSPFNFGVFEVSMIACTVVLIGAFACFAMGLYLDRTSKYLTALRFVLIGTCAWMAFSAYLIPTGFYWCSLVWSVGTGLMMVPIVPVGFAFATEVTFPVSPAMVIGLMTTVGNTVLFGLNYVYLAILSQDDAQGSIEVFLLFAAMALVSVILSLFIHEDLRRASSVSTSPLTNKSKRDTEKMVLVESSESLPVHGVFG